MRKGSRLRGRGEAPGDVVEIGSSRETAEGHSRIDLGGGKGAAATGIQ